MNVPERGQGIIKREHVRLESSQAREPIHQGDGAAGAAVRLLRLGENSHALEYTCPCGHVALIEIEYEAQP